MVGWCTSVVAAPWGDTGGLWIPGNLGEGLKEKGLSVVHYGGPGFRPQCHKRKSKTAGRLRP